MRHRPTTEEEKREARENKKFWIQVATLILLFIYTGVNVGIYWITKTNFQRDERPFVYAIEVDAASPVDPVKGLGSRVVYHNYGKTPALQFKFIGKLFNSPDSFARANEWFTRGGKDLTEAAEGQIIYPTILMQGMQGETLIVTPDTSQIMSEQQVVAIRFQYSDSFGNTYRTEACYWRGANSQDRTLVRCTGHNEIN